MNPFRSPCDKGSPRRRLRLALAAVLLAPGLSMASYVTHQYTALGGNDWSVGFSLVNDGASAGMAGFTVYFDPSLFTALAVSASPAGWDSIAIQPDSSLPAPGFFDTLALSPSALPANGSSLSGFAMTFKWSGTSVDPGRLRYTLNDDAFNALSQGLTVPEPSSALLVGLGIAALAVSLRRGICPASATSTKETQA